MLGDERSERLTFAMAFSGWYARSYKHEGAALESIVLDGAISLLLSSLYSVYDRDDLHRCEWPIDYLH